MTRSRAQALRVLTRIRDFLANKKVTPLIGDLEQQLKQRDESIARLKGMVTQGLTTSRASRAGTIEARRLAPPAAPVISSIVRAGRAMTAPEAEELSTVVRSRSLAMGERVASTEGARVEAIAARRFVRLLDVVVRSALESNRRCWRSGSRWCVSRVRCRHRCRSRAWRVRGSRRPLGRAARRS